MVRLDRRALVLLGSFLLLAGCGSTAGVPTAVPVTVPPSAVPTAPSTAVPPTAVPTLVPTAAPATAVRTLRPTTVVPTAIPTMVPVEVETRLRPEDGMVMVHVPAGEFLMGSARGDRLADARERPQHTVSLDAFWIDRTEVTVAHYRAFVQSSGYRTVAEERGWAYAWVESAGEWRKVDGADWQHPFGPGSSAGADHPVVQMAWRDAAAYCTWAGGSLPTEAQWEKAARGTDGRLYPWGSAFDGALVNYCDARCENGDSSFDDGYRYTAPVGSYPAGASPYGALDMAGNVWEWAADWFDEGYYATSPAQNPAGPVSGQYRVLRGGSWNHDPTGMRSAARLDSPLGDAVDNYGFRCVVPGSLLP